MGRKTTAEMVGEALQEFGVLLLVFAPLERLVVKGEPLTFRFSATVVTVVVGTAGLGIVIERKRKPEA